VGGSGRNDEWAWLRVKCRLFTHKDDVQRGMTDAPGTSFGFDFRADYVMINNDDYQGSLSRGGASISGMGL
jgi:uncharacterized protein involved in tellurium resistance